ncbi:hypothetical protein ACVILH_000146 [Bradyrhizobium sp. USDA 4353]
MVTLLDNYTGRSERHRLQRGQRLETQVWLQQTHGWYDLTVTTDSDANFNWQLAGHVENGRPSISDPAMGKIAAT